MVVAHPLITGSALPGQRFISQGSISTTILLWSVLGPVAVSLGMVALIGLIAWRTHVRGDVERNIRVLEILVGVLPWYRGRRPSPRTRRPAKSVTARKRRS
ncbi:hypothetical protein [Actinomadura oligospora]|uniref:hypothetical protein n=1 Tax=Actinomadura oligospora TaxID=111804 RepID=UPI00047D48A8|nr:hypothetical protein [Actinomadura oligospora]